MLQKINGLLDQISSLTIRTPEELEQYRLKYLSKKGLISDLFDDFRNVPSSEKKDVGQKLNLLKSSAVEKYNTARSELQTADVESTGSDLTRPSYPFPSGTRHPISIVRNEIIDIFMRIGFTVSEGPEIEDDDHVFTKLNFAPEHPARDMQDTFYISRISSEDSDPGDIFIAHSHLFSTGKSYARRKTSDKDNFSGKGFSQ